MNEQPRRSLRLLIVEDNPIDVRLLWYALTYERQWEIEIAVAEDGERAISVLCNGTTVPDYIVLDLNLPKRDGAEVLQVIRSTPELRHTPVAIVSSSPLDVIYDRVTGAHVKADFYFTKPMHVDGFVELGKKLIHCYEEAKAPNTLSEVTEDGS